MMQQQQLDQCMLSSTAQQHTRTVILNRPFGFEWIGTASVLQSNLEPAIFISKVFPGSNASKMGLVEGLQVVNFNGVDVVGEGGDMTIQFKRMFEQDNGGGADGDSIQLAVLPNPMKWDLVQTAVRRNLKSAGGKRAAPQLKYPVYPQLKYPVQAKSCENLATEMILVPGYNCNSPLTELNVPLASRVTGSSVRLI